MPDNNLIGDLFSIKPKKQSIKKTSIKKDIKTDSFEKTKRTTRRQTVSKPKNKDDIISDGLNMVFDGIKNLKNKEKIEIINFAKKYL